MLISVHKTEFLYKLSSCRMVTECMFGRVKSLWCCLGTCLDTNMANTVPVIVTCCALHSVSEGKGECFHPKWAQDQTGLQNLYRQLNPTHVNTCGGSQQAREIGNAICVHNLAQQEGRE